MNKAIITIIIILTAACNLAAADYYLPGSEYDIIKDEAIGKSVQLTLDEYDSELVLGRHLEAVLSHTTFLES